ncbi:hypothetical protein B0H14DRAFT_3662252 [Mycena olivaceomarginata]|nr:hypothetical protein B0H14DRAFT_3662252 [Mycena olivaceomarginata]
MAKKNAKQRAAANHEAAKQNKPLPFQNVPQDDASIVTDPSYTEHDSETNGSEPEATSPSLQALPGLPANKRGGKRKDADADLDSENDKPKKVSRTTEWRKNNGKTAVARRTNTKFQPGIRSIFKSVPNPRKVALAVRKESEEPDSDIEMIESSSTQMKTPIESTQDAPNILPLFNESIATTDDNDVEMVDVVELSPSVPDAAQSVSVVPESMFPASPATKTSATSTSTRLNGTQTDLPNQTELEIKAAHACLQKIIKKNRTELTKKLEILTNANAAALVLDLEALGQFNDKWQELSFKRLRTIKSLSSASRLMRSHIKRKIKTCNPKTEASMLVAHRCGKGEQGKGAHHESLLLNPQVCDALKEWVKGTLEVEKGGFRDPDELG